MKLKKNIKVEVEVNGEKAEVSFQNPKANKLLMFFEQYRDLADKSTEELKSTYSLVLNEITDVQGITWDDDKPISKEDICNFEVPFNLIVGIVAGYVKIVQGGEKDPTKEKSSEDLSIA